MQNNSNKPRELYLVLAELYPQEDDSRPLVRAAEISEGSIKFSRRANTNWSEIVKVAKEQGRLKILVDKVIDEKTLNEKFVNELRFATEHELKKGQKNVNGASESSKENETSILIEPDLQPLKQQPLESNTTGVPEEPEVLAGDRSIVSSNLELSGH